MSRTTHEKLMRIVTVIGGRKVTVSSYVENILTRHFEQHQDEINALYESNYQKTVLAMTIIYCIIAALVVYYLALWGLVINMQITRRKTAQTMERFLKMKT